jgi:hypothetical protein
MNPKILPCLAGLVAGLTACGSSEQNGRSVSDLVWHAAPGNSHRARTENPDGTRETVYRCWPVADGFDCLQVSRIQRTGYEIDRFQAPSLPSHPDGIPDDRNYSCAFASDGDRLVHEQIRDNGRVLIARAGPLTGGTGDPPWSREFVERYFASNGLGPAATQIFDCDRISRALGKGSLATIGSSSFTRAMLLR